MASTFAAFVVRRDGSGRVSAAIESMKLDDLPAGDVLIHVAFSSLNYKDAMACRGNPGIVSAFPHVPGIDCAGTVVSCDGDAFSPGDDVLVTGYELGARRWGGYADFVRIPSEWVVSLPEAMTLQEAMTYGTAGFTAAQSVAAIVDHAILPADGDLVVSGSSGGVGCLSVAILSKAGYRVVAVTGKQRAHEFLRGLGAQEILDRNAVVDTTDRPLLKARWAAAIDTVGGATLATILRSTKHRACVAACGLVGGTDLPMTVYPFILRGTMLAGIDSANCPIDRRIEMWRRLNDEWRVPNLASIATEVTLRELPEAVDSILAGESLGRTVVRLGP